MTTEAEAVLMTCPIIYEPMRSSHDGSPKCQISRCMAWRWAEPSTEYQDFVYEEEKPEGDGWEKLAGTFNAHYRWRRPRRDRHGFCGLAGGQGAPI